MDPAVIGALVNAGIGGIGLYLFAKGSLLAKSVVDELLAKLGAVYETALLERDKRILELKADRDQWKRLALGTERRLDRVVPTLATAVGAPVPSSDDASEA